ncbi:TerD family protein, partial [Bacillus pumilus]|uniref:TerD family protein n=1 Tax=Bacillus pumilus TaxID=1408 RepID=UPI0011A5A7B5
PHNPTRQGHPHHHQILLHFSKIPPNIHPIPITLTIHDPHTPTHNFPQLSNPFLPLLNQHAPQQFIPFHLPQHFSIQTPLVLSQLYPHKTDSKSNPIPTT